MKLVWDSVAADPEVNQEDPLAAPDGHYDELENPPEVLRCLFEEHRHLGALVNALEHRAGQSGRLGSADYYLMRDIVGYLHDYPDKVHHPTENLLFEKLLVKEPSMVYFVKRLRRDHDTVAQETAELQQLLEEAIEEPDDEKEDAVREASKVFVAHQRTHMSFENREMFPAAIDTLSQEDWEEIEAHFAAVDDPLFGRIVGSRHRILYEYLMNPADRASEQFTVSRLFSLERLIMTVEVVETSVEMSCASLRNLGESVFEETGSALARALKPESPLAVLGMPLKYASSISRSILVCGGDLFGIFASAAKNTFDIYYSRHPD